MYLNYVNDRKSLGYKVIKDTTDGIKLVLIMDSAIPMIRTFLKPAASTKIKIKKRKRKF